MQLNKEHKKKRFILNIHTPVYIWPHFFFFLICVEPCFALIFALSKDFFGGSLSEGIFVSICISSLSLGQNPGNLILVGMVEAAAFGLKRTQFILQEQIVLLCACGWDPALPFHGSKNSISNFCFECRHGLQRSQGWWALLKIRTAELLKSWDLTQG